MPIPNLAQDFFVDPALVANAASVGVSSVDLYFSGVPAAVGNKSGISYPGVSVMIVPCVNSVPDVSQLDFAPRSRVEYNSVVPSTDAGVATRFSFDRPVTIATGIDWALVVSFDGSEDFTLWQDHAGDDLVGTTQPSSGPQGRGVGPLFAYTSVGAGGVSSQGSSAAWNPLPSRWLKFGVRAARYQIGGNAQLESFSNGNPMFVIDPSPTFANSSQLVLPALRTEYLTYDRSVSRASPISVGERLYQNTVFYPGGVAPNAVLSVTADDATVTAVSGVNWSTLLSLGGADPEYIVVTSQNHLGANADLVAVRQVVEVVSNTVIVVDDSFPFTNTGAYFFRSPVAFFEQAMRARLFGNTADLVIASKSTANVTMRFASDSVTAVSVTAGGTGYSNSDLVHVTGFESIAGVVLGGYEANAALVTNATGGIVSVAMANLGCGFANSAALTIAVSNSTGGTSSGSGATLAANVGSVLKSELLGRDGKGGYLVGCRLVNVEVGDSWTGLGLRQPLGVGVEVRHRLPYYATPYANAVAGLAYFCDADGAWDEFDVTPGIVEHPWQLTKRRVLPSWSRELVTPYANGTSCRGLGGSTDGGAVGPTSNSSVVLVSVSSNNDWTHATVTPDETTITFSRYVINGDYSRENTNYGNAWARGVESKFVLASNTQAEDLFVWATTYRPPGTDVIAFARLYNGSVDPEAFDDKDWTMLTLVDNPAAFSTPNQLSDFREYTYQLPLHPNTGGPLAGFAQTTLSGTTLTGSNTAWTTDANGAPGVASGDLLLIYPALFPNNYMIAVVNVVTNSTSLTITRPVANNGLVGPGVVVERVAYPLQAFRNQLNDNVARYYTSTRGEVDRFDTIQVKLVHISSNVMIVPLVDDVRVVAVSA